ncbi:acyl-CoA N-acyltransferase [Cladochytrium replicatum]|nr:acyl-CoA N-acyltransferase [Cladochytrium replicatum]
MTLGTNSLQLPLQDTLKDGTPVELWSVDKNDAELVELLRGYLNHEIECGNTYPQEFPISPDEFGAYFLPADAFVLRLQATGEVVGTFNVKPNYPGRCASVCNAGFITAPGQRNRGVGKVLARSFLHVAPRLGYRSSVFNLVFETNVASLRLWDSLGFQRVGRIKKCARLKKRDGDGEEWVDAIMFQYEFDVVDK